MEQSFDYADCKIVVRTTEHPGGFAWEYTIDGTVQGSSEEVTTPYRERAVAEGLTVAKLQIDFWQDKKARRA
jgi:hypothetical protein